MTVQLTPLRRDIDNSPNNNLGGAVRSKNAVGKPPTHKKDCRGVERKQQSHKKMSLQQLH